MTDHPIAPATPKQSWLGLAWSHAAILVAVVPVVAAAVRVMLYSGGDPVVLKTLVETLNVLTLLLGTLLPMLPAFAFFGVQIVTLNSGALVGLLRTTPARLGVLFGLVLWLLIGQFPSTQWIVGALILGFITQILLRAFVPRKTLRAIASWVAAPPEEGKIVSSTTWISLAAAIVLVLVVPQGMWLPLERISRTGADDQIAYVLKDAEGWTTTIANDRSIEVFRSSDVTARVVCDQGKYTSLLTMLTGSNPKTRDDC